MEAAKFSLVSWPEYCKMDREVRAKIVAFKRASFSIEEYARNVANASK